MPSRRILYAGDDADLPARLRSGLAGLDCFVVRSPVNVSRTFIRSDIKYALLLFDETPEGVELERFARSLSHLAHTPIILIKKSEELGSLLKVIRQRLGTTRAP